MIGRGDYRGERGRGLVLVAPSVGWPAAGRRRDASRSEPEILEDGPTPSGAAEGGRGGGEERSHGVSHGCRGTTRARVRRGRRAPRRLQAAVAAAAASGTGDPSSTAEVRRVLADLVEREPEARSNPSVQAAYMALDNMESEELEAISAESALLWKEQQALIREMARAKHAASLATMRLQLLEYRATAGGGSGGGGSGGGRGGGGGGGDGGAMDIRAR